MTRIVWIIKTRDGYVGKRRHSCSVGGTMHSRTAKFRDARIFVRLCDCYAHTEDGDTIVEATLSA